MYTAKEPGIRRKCINFYKRRMEMSLFSWLKKKVSQVKSFAKKTYSTAASFVSKKYKEASSFISSTVSTASSFVKSVKDGTTKLTSSTISSAASWAFGKAKTAANWVGNTVSTAASWTASKIKTASNWAAGTYKEGKEYYDQVAGIVDEAKDLVDSVKSGSVASASKSQSLAYRDHTALSASATSSSVSGTKEKNLKFLAS